LPAIVLARPPGLGYLAWMSVFAFIIILVLIITIGDVAGKVLGPVARRHAEGIARRKAPPEVGPAAPTNLLPDPALEELEVRLARLEDRLAFLEELRAPRRPAELAPPGRDRDELEPRSPR
jgi:hypothetical protein